MKKIILLATLILSLNSFSQIHNRMLKFNIGLSHEQFDLKEGYKDFNDSSTTNYFEHKYALPAFTVSEDFTLNQLFSISSTIGYQFFNTNYNNQKYGTHLFFTSVNPQLSIFYHLGFELYIKLKLGIIYRISKYNELPDQAQRVFPENFNIFTGVSAGFNYFIDNKWGLNTELSLWSPEFINIGVTYRFFKGTLPEYKPEEGYYID